MTNYDVVIIGAGPGGLGLAYPLKQAGLNIAVVEENLWGGTCPNRGCDPKKVLLAAVEARMHSKYLVNNGIKAAPEIDWPALMQFEKTFTAPVSKNSRSGLSNADIDTISGHAEFVDSNTLKVGDKIIHSAKFVIATGQRPGRLMAVKNQELMLTSTDFLKMDQLPDEIAFIGGGYIAFELAMIAAAAGAKVHIIHHNDRPLKDFPKEYVDDLLKQMEAENIQIHLNTDIKEIKKETNRFILDDESGFTLKVDRAFVTAGRKPNDDTLNLEKIGVQTDRGGIVVNDHLETTIKGIFAMGDVISKSHPKLTPVSGFEAQYLAKLLNNQTTEAIDYPAIPTVVYGMPKLAQTGVKLQEALEHEDQYQIQTNETTDWFTYRRLGEPQAKVSVVRERKTNKIVGAVTMSSEAEHLINDFATVINHGGSASEINNQIWAYPTEASDLEYM
ncbi:dihydrolipoyl dehydrogenase family protein [Pediococcus stilesii]|uniref:Pyruvate 2-oxoglutarate dehydrogenase complex, dihydrolipoamide dehydrogenase (E3) component n=1 Tax=Pediococcus stilesii TaxID=331679 RepID=A0A0R2L2D6_9LACO|nr:NAD(P)/FAD-dependent oxidoreductase [Pediococcus stilesii]KRN93660.1 pyruvate 2-oxoglutarate dehydrogenase complex, dihydrolipoamide dehydrogenase (E3) component [Pediococcus stilesii]